MGEPPIDFVQKLKKSEVRPVAHVSQLGTSFRDPSGSGDRVNTEVAVADQSASLIAENLSRIMSPGNDTEESPSSGSTQSADASEVGQGDADRHSVQENRDSGAPSWQPRLFSDHQSPSQVSPDEELGAVGGIEDSPRTPGGAASPRVPLLNFPIPDSSKLKEPLRPLFENDRPLSPPVPVAEVEDQAGFIIQSFFEERWRQESGDAPSELVVPQSSSAWSSNAERNPGGDSVTERRADFLSPEHAVDGRRSQGDKEVDHNIRAVSAKLNLIAQEIDQRYSVEFDDMIDVLKINGSTAYEAFAQVAKQMLTGGISWSRVIALLVFGYRMARRFVDLAIPNFVQRIVGYLVKFVCRHVAKWIADRGGWLAILQLEEGISWTGFFGIMSLGFGILAAVTYVRNRL